MIYFFFLERNPKYMTTFYLLLIYDKLPNLFDLPSLFQILHLMTHNSAKVVDYSKNIKFHWYLPKLYKLQSLN